MVEFFTAREGLDRTKTERRLGLVAPLMETGSMTGLYNAGQHTAKEMHTFSFSLSLFID